MPIWWMDKGLWYATLQCACWSPHGHKEDRVEKQADQRRDESTTAPLPYGDYYYYYFLWVFFLRVADWPKNCTHKQQLLTY